MQEVRNACHDGDPEGDHATDLDGEALFELDQIALCRPIGCVEISDPVRDGLGRSAVEPRRDELASDLKRIDVKRLGHVVLQWRI